MVWSRCYFSTEDFFPFDIAARYFESLWIEVEPVPVGVLYKVLVKDMFP